MSSRGGALLVAFVLGIAAWTAAVVPFREADGPFLRPLQGGGNVVMSTDKPCYRTGELVTITATGNAWVPSIGDFPYTFWAITNASGGPVLETFNPATAIGTLDGTLQGTWNQTYHLFNDRPPSGSPVPPGDYVVWFYEIPQAPWYPDTWAPANVTIGDCAADVVADAGGPYAAAEGEPVRFDGTGSRGSAGDVAVVTTDGAGDNGRNPWTPKAAAAPDGTLYVAWLGPADADELQRRIFLSRRDPSGRWAAPVPVTDGSEPENVPAIAVGPSGAVHIAFERPVPGVDLGDIYVVTSGDGSRTFGDPVRVDRAPPGSASFEPEIAVASDGTVYVGWFDTRNDGWDVYVASSRDGGRTFGPDRRVNDTSARHFPPGVRIAGAYMAPTLAAGPDGDLYAAWSQYVAWPGIWFDRSTDRGESWGADLRIDNGTWSISSRATPGLVVGAQGWIHVFWNDYRRVRSGIPLIANEIYYARSEDGGASFAPNRKVNSEPWRTDAGPTSEPHAAADGEGTLFAAYAYWEQPYNHTLRAIASTDHGTDFAPNDTLNLWGTPDEFWPTWSSIRTYAWRDGCFGAVWVREQQGPGVKVVVWDRCVPPEPSAVASYAWDVDARVDSDGDGDPANDIDVTGPTPTWTYGDDGSYTVTLTVTDERGLVARDTADVTVTNVVPAILDVRAYAVADASLRVAGEKWHDVMMEVSRGGTIASVSVVRTPGSPNEQMATIPALEFDLAEFAAITVRYTPIDDPVNGQPWGASPARVVLTAPDGSEVRLHHTFNVRHPETWTWRIGDLRAFLAGLPITFRTTATDPGSDDLTFEWSFGDGTSATTTYFNDGASPDPFPSPDVNPITATDVATHAYARAGTYAVTLTIRDDDDGVAVATLTISLG